MTKAEITSCIWHKRAEQTFEINTLDTLFVTKKAESYLNQAVFCRQFRAARENPAACDWKRYLKKEDKRLHKKRILDIWARWGDFSDAWSSYVFSAT